MTSEGGLSVSTEVAPFGASRRLALGVKGAEHGVEDDLEIKYLRLGDTDS